MKTMYLYWRITTLSFVISVILHIVILQIWAVRSDDPSAVNVTCPEICVCGTRTSFYERVDLHFTDCSGNNLTSFPNGISLNTEILILKRNVIASLDELKSFKKVQELDLSSNLIYKNAGVSLLRYSFKTLRWLNLRNNSILYLQKGDFTATPNLEVLDLSENKIDSIQTATFYDLHHLSKLVLSGNRLQVISGGWLSTIPQIQELFLDNNQLTELNPTLFDDLKGLTKLSLRQNQITTLPSNIFQNIVNLQVLYLSQNKFGSVPTKALQSAESLTILLFDENPLKRITANAFSNLTTVMELSVSYMSDLELVEHSAFKDLQKLVTLQIHDNKQLFFIEPNSFENLPNLRHLYIHNNRLITLQRSIADLLPSIQEIHLYRNPLHCDCNIRWIIEALYLFENENSTVLEFPGSNKLMCDSPYNLTNVPLQSVSLDMILPECSPTTIPLFKDSYQLEVGEGLKLECFALGIPQPLAYWILSNGKIINTTSPDHHIRIADGTTLIIDDITANDAGTFVCVATNEIGFDTCSTAIKVHTSTIHVVPLRLSKTFMTITWNSTQATVKSSHYRILCKEWKTQKVLKEIFLHPSLKRYKISNLKPGTTYELCIAYEHDGLLNHVNCVNVTTLSSTYNMGITRVSKTKVIVIGVSILFSVAFLACALLVLMKRTRRKGYEKPDHNKEQTEKDKQTEPLSNIPLDNLFQPIGTPLCTSKTSLLTTSSQA